MHALRRCGGPVDSPLAVPARTLPRYPLQLLFLVGNASFIGAWVMTLTRPPGWSVLGPLLALVFLGARVGGMWWYARRAGDASGHLRRSAWLTTAVALLATGLWAWTFVHGPD
jgi:hypothetical protein